MSDMNDVDNKENTTNNNESKGTTEKTKSSEFDLKTASNQEYLDHTVCETVLMGMAELAKVRPSNPVEWLAMYLLSNNPEFKKSS